MKEIKVSRTTSYTHSVFNNIVERTQETNESFSDVVNDLLRKGIESTEKD